MHPAAAAPARAPRRPLLPSPAPALPRSGGTDAASHNGTTLPLRPRRMSAIEDLASPGPSRAAAPPADASAKGSPPSPLTGSAFYGSGASWQYEGHGNRLLTVTALCPYGVDRWRVWCESGTTFDASGDHIREALRAGYRPNCVGPAEGEHIKIAIAFLNQACWGTDPRARADALAWANVHLELEGIALSRRLGPPSRRPRRSSRRLA